MIWIFTEGEGIRIESRLSYYIFTLHIILFSKIIKRLVYFFAACSVISILNNIKKSIFKQYHFQQLNIIIRNYWWEPLQVRILKIELQLKYFEATYYFQTLSQ